MHEFRLDHRHYYTFSEMHKHHSHYMEMRDLQTRICLDEFARARIKPDVEQWLDACGFPYEIRYIREESCETLNTYIAVQFDDSAPAVLFKLAWGG